MWTLPNTLLGIALGLMNASLPRLEDGVLNIYLRRSGVVRTVCGRIGISAFTMGDCVVYMVQPTPNLRVHEGRHIAQYHALGPLFLPVYFLLLMFFGYEEHPLEQDARQHERTVCGSEGPSKLRRSE